MDGVDGARQNKFGKWVIWGCGIRHVDFSPAVFSGERGLSIFAATATPCGV